MQDDEQTVDISSTPKTDAVTRNACTFRPDVGVVPAEYARTQELVIRELAGALGEHGVKRGHLSWCWKDPRQNPHIDTPCVCGHEVLLRALRS